MANPFDIANFNLTNFAQILPDVLDSDPKTVEYTYKDASGNIKTKNVENRGLFKQHLWDDVGGALGQFNRTFYVDAENGDDNNDGSASNPFKTIQKAITSTPIGGKCIIYVTGNYILDASTSVSLRDVHIYLKNGAKLYGKWFVYSGTDKARLFNISINSGSLHIYLEQYDKNGEPSQIIIPANDTGKDLDGEYYQLFLYSGGNAQSSLKIEYRNKVNGANVIEVNDGKLFKSYTWGREHGHPQIKIQGHYSGSKIMINTDTTANYFIDFKGSPGTFVWQTDDGTLIDQDGNSLSISEHIGGITRDADSGNPINVISNINLSN